MGLAQALREKRRDLGLTQEEAAPLLTVSQQTVAKWELGTTRPSRKRAITEAISAFLGIDYREALVLIDEEPVGADRQTIMGKLDEIGARLCRVEEHVGLVTVGAPSWAARESNPEPPVSLPHHRRWRRPESRMEAQAEAA